MTEDNDYLKMIADEMKRSNDLKEKELDLRVQEAELSKITAETHLTIINTLAKYILSWADKSIPDDVLGKTTNLVNVLDNFIIKGSNVDIIKNLISIPWEANTHYDRDMIVSYQGNIYKVIQKHTSQDNWTPDVHHTGFVLIATEQDIEDVEDGKCPEFVQPTAQTVYNKDDCVVFKGKTYVSLINGNGWSPEEYPAGWKQI